MEDLILKNAKLYANPGCSPLVSEKRSIVISGGKIAMIDTFQRIRSEFPYAKIKDLNGQVLLPGFIDSHIHLLQTGYLKVNLNVSGTNSIQELKDLIKNEARKKAPGEWIIGTSFYETYFEEKRAPTKNDLDEAAPFNPVFLIRVCTHMFVVNSRALEVTGIDNKTLAPCGGIICRDKDGNLTGVLKENAADRVYDCINDDYKLQKEALKAALREVKKYGITTVHDMAIGIKNITHYQKLLDIYKEVLMEEDYPLRIILGVEHHLMDDILKEGIEFLQGDDYFRQGYVKIFVDGSFGSRTALLKEKYQDGEGYGLLAIQERDINALVSKATKRGYQCAIHALGDRALEKAVNLLAPYNGELRHRIVHAGIADSDLINKISRYNIGVDFQPNFVSSEVAWITNVLGRQQLTNLYKWKSMLDQGVLLSAGSDSPVEPVNPFLGIKSAVLRQNIELWPAEGFNPEERLTVEDMLRAYTYNPAFQYFEEDLKGCIKPGSFGDLVVLSGDPFETSSFELDRIEVIFSFVGGRLVYQGEDCQQVSYERQMNN